MDSIATDSVALDAYNKTITHLPSEPKESKVAGMEDVEIPRNEDSAGHGWSFRFGDQMFSADSKNRCSTSPRRNTLL